MKNRITHIDDMDAPCRCSCGRWFDLEDGYGSKHSNEVVCNECHEVEQEAEDIENEIEDIRCQIDNKEIGKREGKKQINELVNRLTNLSK